MSSALAFPGTPGSLVLGVLALVLLDLVFLSLPAIRRRRALKAELDDAERRAELVAQQTKAIETAQRNRVEHNRARLTTPIQQQGLQDKTTVRKPISGLRPPNGGELVDRNTKYCPNCHPALTSSESGSRLCIQPSTSSASSSAVLTTIVVFDSAYIKAGINVRQLMKQEG
jgi:hypothetical protein